MDRGRGKTMTSSAVRQPFLRSEADWGLFKLEELHLQRDAAAVTADDIVTALWRHDSFQTLVTKARTYITSPIQHTHLNGHAVSLSTLHPNLGEH